MDATRTLSRLTYPIFGLLALIELLVALRDDQHAVFLLPPLLVLQMLMIVAARQVSVLTGHCQALHQAYEEELRFSRQSADASSPALTLLDTDGRISYVNPACEAMLGYSARDMIGRLPGEFAENDIHYTVEDLSRPKTCTLDLRRADGGLLKVLVSDRPYWHHGRLAGNLATMVPLESHPRQNTELN